MAQIGEQLASKEIHGVFFIFDDNPRFEIVFDDGSGHVPVNMEVYRKVEEEFLGEKALATDDVVFVDREWAYSLIESSEDS